MRASVRGVLPCALILTVCCLAAVAVDPTALRAQDKEAEYVAELEKAEEAMALRNFEQALEAFKRASSLRNKTSAEAHLGIARAQHSLGVFNKAADSCKDALKHCGDNQKLVARIQNQWGLALFGQSRKPSDKYVREAEAAFRAALEADNQQLISRFNLGLALLRQGRDDDGRAELSAFAKAVPEAPEAAAAWRFIDNPRRARENYAPDFALTTLDEQRLTLEDLKGKVVLLDFWATWCGPCVKATPGLKTLHNRYKDRPFIVGISLDYQPEEWRSYVPDNKMDWPQYLDREAGIARLFNVRSIPTYVLIDHEGIVRETQAGWSPSVDGWLNSIVNRFLKAIPE